MSLNQLEQFIFEKMSETKLPGLSASVVRGSEVVWARGFGFRDLAHGLAATPHTLYAIASLTKSFTSLAIMQLAEQGKLDIDDPVERYIPFDIHPEGETVRLWHLMSHTSGIPALAYAESVIRGAIGADSHWLPVAGYEDILTFMQDAHDWITNKPGERYFYLNEGYVLLGAIIEQCSGLPHREYVRQHILIPLGMKRTFFDKVDVDKDQDTATPYIITQNGDRLPSTYPYGGITSDGGMISNVFDLARYIAMYLRWGEIDGGRLISRESVEAMQTPRAVSPYRDGPFGDYSYGYGLGSLPDFLGHRLIEHSGSVGVATSYMGFIPEEGMGITLMANGTGYPMSQFGRYGLAVLLGKDPEALPFVRRERALDELEGMYETYKGTMKARVNRSGDFLNVIFEDRYTRSIVPLIPEALDEETRTFYTYQLGHKLPVEFRLRDGQIDLIYERYLLKRTGKLP